MTTFKSCFLPISCGLLSLSSAIASAQLEEVVVTAQKRQESLQDVPIAISAFTQQTMKDMGIVNAQDLQVSTPGLVFTSVGTLGSPYLRGIGTRFSLNGLDNSVAVYVGDRYVPRGSGNQLELGIDVDRVEVLKGPQGILYGRNATGGAIRVIKKPVTEEFEASIKATAGKYNLREFAGTVNIPVTDSFGMRLSGQTTKRDAWQDNLAFGVDPIAVEDINNKDVFKLSGMFRWDISDNTLANLAVDYWSQDDYQGHDGSLLGPPELNVGVALFDTVYSTGRDKAGTDTNQPTDGDQLSGELTIEHSLERFDLISVTTYTDFDMRWTSESDGSAAHIFTPAIAFDVSETFSQEFRLSSDDGGQLQWTLGAFYYEDEHSTEFNFFSDLPSMANASQGKQTTNTMAAALFGHMSWQLAEDWGLKLGARYSYENREVLLADSSRTGINTITPGLPFTAEESWDEITPLVTLEYTMDNALAYLTYTRGFKSGGFNFPAVSTANGLDPETLDMIELGFKGDFLNDSLRMNAALFYYDYSDLQVTRASSTGAAPFTENAAEAELFGLDVDMTWLVTDALTLRAGLSVLDSEYTDYKAAPQIYSARFDNTFGTANPTPGMRAPRADLNEQYSDFDAKGESLLRASDYSYFVTASYEFTAGEARIPVSVTYSYKDDFNYDFPVDPVAAEWLSQEGYGLLSARASYVAADDRWSVSLWGRNLTDEEYFNEVAGNAMGLRGFWAEPRTYGVDLEFSF
jgi:iron complex outermembrane receptor protein